MSICSDKKEESEMRFDYHFVKDTFYVSVFNPPLVIIIMMRRRERRWLVEIIVFQLTIGWSGSDEQDKGMSRWALMMMDHFNRLTVN